MQLPLPLMGKRGMLPKFRPATLGQDAPARPSIRPVKPGPPPPPPSPPRRMPSGFGPKGTGAAAFAQTSLENDLDDQLEASTVVGNGDPATLNRGPETVLEPARNPRVGRVDARELTFEEETQARPVDDRLLDKLRREDARAANAANAGSSGSPDFGVAYESLPSLEVRRPFDTYEAAFSERDPAKQLHAARESPHVRRK